MHNLVLSVLVDLYVFRYSRPDSTEAGFIQDKTRDVTFNALLKVESCQETALAFYSYY